MVATLSANAPYNLSKAKAFAEQHNVSYRSVIAKVKSLGLPYEKLAPAPRKEQADSGPTKVQILGEIRGKLGMPAREGDLTKAELAAILASL
jgi:transposase